MTKKELLEFIQDLGLNDNGKVTLIVGEVSSDNYQVVKVTSEGLLIISGVGDSDDVHSVASLFGRIAKLDDHAHTQQHVYPTQAEEVGGNEGDGALLTTNAGNWALGAIVEIIPANKITSEFDIHEILVEDVNTQDKTYEIVLYYGAGDTECGRARFAATSNKGGVPNVAMQTTLIPANSRLRAQLAIEGGGSKTVKLSLRYHKY